MAQALVGGSNHCAPGSTARTHRRSDPCPRRWLRAQPVLTEYQHADARWQGRGVVPSYTTSPSQHDVQTEQPSAVLSSDIAHTGLSSAPEAPMPQPEALLQPLPGGSGSSQQVFFQPKQQCNAQAELMDPGQTGKSSTPSNPPHNQSHTSNHYLLERVRARLQTLTPQCNGTRVQDGDLQPYLQALDTWTQLTLTYHGWPHPGQDYRLLSYVAAASGPYNWQNRLRVAAGSAAAGLATRHLDSSALSQLSVPELIALASDTARLLRAVTPDQHVMRLADNGQALQNTSARAVLDAMEGVWTAVGPGSQLEAGVVHALQAHFTSTPHAHMPLGDVLVFLQALQGCHWCPSTELMDTLLDRTLLHTRCTTASTGAKRGSQRHLPGPWPLRLQVLEALGKLRYQPPAHWARCWYAASLGDLQAMAGTLSSPPHQTSGCADGGEGVAVEVHAVCYALTILSVALQALRLPRDVPPGVTWRLAWFDATRACFTALAAHWSAQGAADPTPQPTPHRARPMKGRPQGVAARDQQQGASDPPWHPVPSIDVFLKTAGQLADASHGSHTREPGAGRGDSSGAHTAGARVFPAAWVAAVESAVQAWLQQCRDVRVVPDVARPLLVRLQHRPGPAWWAALLAALPPAHLVHQVPVLADVLQLMACARYQPPALWALAAQREVAQHLHATRGRGIEGLHRHVTRCVHALCDVRAPLQPALVDAWFRMTAPVLRADTLQPCVEVLVLLAARRVPIAAPWYAVLQRELLAAQTLLLRPSDVALLVAAAAQCGAPLHPSAWARMYKDVLHPALSQRRKGKGLTWKRVCGLVYSLSRLSGLCPATPSQTSALLQHACTLLPPPVGDDHARTKTALDSSRVAATRSQALGKRVSSRPPPHMSLAPGLALVLYGTARLGVMPPPGWVDQWLRYLVPVLPHCEERELRMVLLALLQGASPGEPLYTAPGMLGAVLVAARQNKLLTPPPQPRARSARKPRSTSVRVAGTSAAPADTPGSAPSAPGLAARPVRLHVRPARVRTPVALMSDTARRSFRARRKRYVVTRTARRSLRALLDEVAGLLHVTAGLPREGLAE